MASRFNFGDEDTYVPSRFSPRSQQALKFEQNDERFAPPKINTKIGFMPDDEEPEKDPDPYHYGAALDRYRRELGAEQPALAKYRNAMENMPQRQDYDLNKWGKLGAALSGFGAGYQDPAKGVAVATALREAPYKRALTDYDNQLKNLGEVAGFEDDDRKNRMAGIKLELDTIKNRRESDKADRLADSTINRNNKLNTKTDADIAREAEIARVDAAYKAGQISVAQRNAETNRINAGTNQANAASSRMNAITNQGNLGLNLKKFDYGQSRDNVKDYQWGAELYQKDREIDNKANGNPSWLTPGVQRDAEDYVTNNMMQDPRFRDFFDSDPRGYTTRKQLTEQQQLDPKFEAFEREWARQINAAENARRGNANTFTRVK